MLGSLTATPSIRPAVSCSAAASAAPAPLLTLLAMTMVFAGVMSFVRRPSGSMSPYLSFSTQKANSAACSVNLPQSFSGFCSLCACLTANRLGVAVLKAVRSAADSRAVKLLDVPAVVASARRPSIRLTVLFCTSCTPLPVPLSV